MTIFRDKKKVAKNEKKMFFKKNYQFLCQFSSFSEKLGSKNEKSGTNCVFGSIFWAQT